MDPEKMLNARSEFGHLLRIALGLPFIGKDSKTPSATECADVLFVCVDFENGEQIKAGAASGTFGSRKINAQAGISILDPKKLSSTSSKEALVTYNFGSGGSLSYKRKVDRRFFFGETTWLDQLADLLTSMEKLLDRSRNIVLVGHGLNGDCQVLQSLGFDFDSSIVGYIDTAEAARATFGGTSLRLKDLLARLGLVVEGCHVAGNDANFTLRALLLLALEDCPTYDLLNESTKGIVGTIRELALEPLPPLVSPPSSQIPKKAAIKDSDAPIPYRGWIFFGRLPEFSQDTTSTQKHQIAQQPENDSTSEYANSHQTKSYDFRQPSDLLLQWCPKLKHTRL
ncbi:uncharacterized protein LY89DRAFT_746830 [Mollisia scopiformis]|uniref:Gfd2/YDR514C-like C-terminal domain-containing protein n=1 Tax=Mollisia scopiformis TaxID=149040 RepID=A0A194XAV2_MOLSC|nr:uncharacterized protein LY89DRAFT_746830 [Mollisia scopiformis]KUJ17301.1 hypothetical protein LY89DRAFT_746830 [Mollisia scopiformis]